MFQSTTFALDKVYGPSERSEEMYEDLVKPLVPWAWSGGISTLFAYGQTGSGKTYSISQLEELVAEDLMDGSLEGSRDVYVCVFELIGHNAFGYGPCHIKRFLTNTTYCRSS